MKVARFISILILLSGLINFSLGFAQTPEEKIVYKYKKYQKFDFEDLVIEGEVGAPGDLSISPRFQKRFKHKLPYRKNFNDRIKQAIVKIR